MSEKWAMRKGLVRQLRGRQIGRRGKKRCREKVRASTQWGYYLRMGERPGCICLCVCVSVCACARVCVFEKKLKFMTLSSQPFE